MHFFFGEFSRKKETEAEQKALERLLVELDEDEIDMDDTTKSDANLKLDIVVHWVTPSTPFNAFKSKIIAYGNEADTDCLYGRVCMIVEIGPPGDREGMRSQPSDRASKHQNTSSSSYLKANQVSRYLLICMLLWSKACSKKSLKNDSIAD